MQKIDRLGIADSVIKLRPHMTLEETAQALSNSTKEKISAMDIQRWEKENKITYPEKSNIIAVGVPVDCYREVINTNNLMAAHVSRINSQIEKCKISSSPETGEEKPIPVDLLNAYTNALEKKHKAALDMVKLEKELLNPMNYKKQLQAVVEALKKTNKEFKEYQLELNKKYQIEVPVFDLEQEYRTNLQILQEKLENEKK